jgi:hypothetical protein
LVSSKDKDKDFKDTGHFQELVNVFH